MTGERFELVISPTARRQLTESLPESAAFAAYDFIVGPLRGTYRVIYRIDDAHHRVTVVGVVHRSDAYR